MSAAYAHLDCGASGNDSFTFTFTLRGIVELRAELFVARASVALPSKQDPWGKAWGVEFQKQKQLRATGEVGDG